MNSKQIKLEEQSHREAVKKRRHDLQQAKDKSYISGTKDLMVQYIALLCLLMRAAVGSFSFAAIQ